jgi:hypothetical protein
MRTWTQFGPKGPLASVVDLRHRLGVDHLGRAGSVDNDDLQAGQHRGAGAACRVGNAVESAFSLVGNDLEIWGIV